MKELINQFKEDKNKKDKNEYVNDIKQYIYYSDLSIKIKEIKRTITENAHELCTGINLIDVSKLPKDITLQILEGDYITKKNNKDFVQNITIKNAIDSIPAENSNFYLRYVDLLEDNESEDDEPLDTSSDSDKEHLLYAFICFSGAE